MPTPILKIPIDDAAFKRFLETFNKYQEQLNSQSDVWKGVNESVTGLALAGAAIAAEIGHQAEETRRLAKEEQSQATAKKKADQEQKDRDREAADREEKAAERRRHAISQVKEYSRSLADAAINLGKWAVIGEGASFAAGALSFWGLDRLVAGVGEQRRLSQGLGVSMGQQQGAALNMQRYFDVNSVLENVANAQATPSSWALFRMMGIDPTGKNPSDLTNEAALSARRMFINDRGNLGLAEAQGLTQLFSPDDLRRLAATPEKDLQQSIADSKKYAANSGLRDDVGRKWQNFLINLDTAGLRIKNTLIDKLTILENNGDLDKIIQKFGDLAVQVLDRIDFTKLGQGLDSFTKFIGSQQFQDDFKTFVDDIELVAKKLADALVWLGVIPAPGDTGGSGGAQASGIPQASAAGMPSAGGVLGKWGTNLSPLGQKLLGPLNFGGAGSSAWDTQYAGQNLLKWGWDQGQTKGILSNLSAESGMDPLQWQHGISRDDPDAGYGLAQWNASRRGVFKQLFGHSMESVTDPAEAMKEQLEFLQWELTSSDPRNHLKKAGDDLKKARGAYASGFEVSKEYERPKGGNVTAAVRGLKAQVTLDIKNQTGASVATTVNSAAGG